jgi:membrane protein DedA with SNARE-associated domain
MSGDRVAGAPVLSSETQPNAAAAPAKKDIRLPPVVWVTGLAAIIGAMLYFFTGRRVTR